jgi:hypothetical protein
MTVQVDASAAATTPTPSSAVERQKTSHNGTASGVGDAKSVSETHARIDRNNM